MKSNDECILSYFDSHGEEILEQMNGDDICMVWNYGYDLTGETEMYVNLDNLEIQIIRIYKT